MLFIHVGASAELVNVEVAELVPLDGEGRTVARAMSPWSLRRDARPTPRRAHDFAEEGTTPFDGRIKPTDEIRLRIHRRSTRAPDP